MESKGVFKPASPNDTSTQMKNWMGREKPTEGVKKGDPESPSFRQLLDQAERDPRKTLMLSRNEANNPHFLRALSNHINIKEVYHLDDGDASTPNKFGLDWMVDAYMKEKARLIKIHMEDQQEGVAFRMGGDENTIVSAGNRQALESCMQKLEEYRYRLFESDDWEWIEEVFNEEKRHPGRGERTDFSKVKELRTRAQNYANLRRSMKTIRATLRASFEQHITQTKEEINVQSFMKWLHEQELFKSYQNSGQLLVLESNELSYMQFLLFQAQLQKEQVKLLAPSIVAVNVEGRTVTPQLLRTTENAANNALHSLSKPSEGNGLQVAISQAAINDETDAPTAGQLEELKRSEQYWELVKKLQEKRKQLKKDSKILRKQKIEEEKATKKLKAIGPHGSLEVIEEARQGATRLLRAIKKQQEEIQPIVEHIGSLQRDLNAAATTDPVTNALRREVAKTMLLKPGDVYLTHIDLCRLGPLNKNYGYAAGDAVLLALKEGVEKMLLQTLATPAFNIVRGGRGGGELLVKTNQIVRWVVGGINAIIKNALDEWEIQEKVAAMLLGRGNQRTKELELAGVFMQIESLEKDLLENIASERTNEADWKTTTPLTARVVSRKFVKTQGIGPETFSDLITLLFSKPKQDLLAPPQQPAESIGDKVLAKVGLNNEGRKNLIAEVPSSQLQAVQVTISGLSACIMNGDEEICLRKIVNHLSMLATLLRPFQGPTIETVMKNIQEYLPAVGRNPMESGEFQILKKEE
jgi:GGDEF domain-containing protein